MKQQIYSCEEHFTHFTTEESVPELVDGKDRIV